MPVTQATCATCAPCAPCATSSVPSSSRSPPRLVLGHPAAPAPRRRPQGEQRGPGQLPAGPGVGGLSPAPPARCPVQALVWGRPSRGSGCSPRSPTEAPRSGTGTHVLSGTRAERPRNPPTARDGSSLSNDSVHFLPLKVLNIHTHVIHYYYYHLIKDYLTHFHVSSNYKLKLFPL